MIMSKQARHALIPLAALMLALALLVGCASRQPDPRIIKDRGLNYLADVKVEEHPRDDGFTVLQISGTNETLKTRKFFYKVEWFDSQGLIQDTFQSRWKQATAQAKVPFTITEMSPTPTAKNWRLMLKHDLK